MRIVLLVLVVAQLCTLISGNRLLGLNTVDDFMNICLDGSNHKSKPGPESSLFSKCALWKDRSCCTEEISQQLHLNKTWYNLDYNHCQVEMSQKCWSHFTQDLCFYECSPNVGPWLVQVDQRIRNERSIDVPLCQAECNLWWDDCKDDFTCVENWPRQFNWSTGQATCPTGSTCRTFTDIYKTANNFCEKVWDHSWKVVNESHPGGCFLISWPEGTENPNYQVALNNANTLVSAAYRHSTISLLCLILCSILSTILIWKHC